jgi:hypothetical protein
MCGRAKEGGGGASCEGATKELLKTIQPPYVDVVKRRVSGVICVNKGLPKPVAAPSYRRVQQRGA